MKYTNLTLFCLAVLFVALLSGCGGGGGGSQGSGTTTTADTSATPAPAPTATPVQTSTVQLNMSFAGTGKAEKTASAETVGLPAATVNVEIHIVDPATNNDVVSPQLVVRTVGALQQTVSITGVPQGTWKLIVRALGNGNAVLGYFNSTVAANAAIVVVLVNTSETLASIAVTPATASIGVGSTQTFHANGTFTPTNNTADLSVLCSWSSSSTTVASIGSHGTATGLTAGQSTIVASLDGNSGSATLTVSGTSPTPTPSPSPSASPTVVGTSVCQGCHTAQPFANYYHAGDAIDSTTSSVTYMDLKAYGSIYNIYSQSVHGLSDAVTCEGCHGGGSQHYGTGPIPYYMPGIAQCGSCHDSLAPGSGVTSNDTIDLTAFNATGHANPGSMPEKYFFQGGVGTDQAVYHSEPEWKDVAGTVPVSKNEHIEECSVCHSPDQKASHIAKGDVQDPPQVGCAGCHDPHNPAEAVRNYVNTRTADGTDAPVAPDQVPNFKPVQVNLIAPQAGAQNKVSGTWIRPRLHFAYKAGGDAAQTFSGYTNQTTAGDWLRLTPDRLCAACHTKGQYKYGRKYGSTAITETHQEDVYTAYKLSGHGNPLLPPWEEFSLMAGPGHRPQYPLDMGGRPGQNGITVAFDGRNKIGGVLQGDNVFACFQCHNGIATIDYINGTIGGNGLGDANAHIVWGDTTPTCITCHDPHKSAGTTTKNVRLPKYNSYNSAFKPDSTPTGTGNARGGVTGKFQDLTDIPTNVGNNVICLFCHQGRESGWTVWNGARKTRMGLGDTDQAAKDFWYDHATDPINVAGVNFTNSHYLAAGSLLYGRNGAEFLGKAYSDGIPKHIEKGCTGCHMGNTDLSTPGSEKGGHTWTPNIVTCQECHAGVQSFHDIIAPTDYDANGTRSTVFEELGTLVSIAPAAWERKGDTTNGSAVVANTTTTDLAPGMPVAGTGIPGGATIATVDSATQYTLSAAATATGAQVTLTITNNTASYPGHAGPIYGTGKGGTGLFGLVNEAFWDAGIEYDAGAYPYFFKAGLVHKSSNAYKAWTPNTLSAAFNLQQQYKTGAAGEQAAYVHNPFYTTQLFIDGLAVTPTFGSPATGPFHLTGTGGGGTTTFAAGRPVTAIGGTTHTGRDYRTLNVP